jgi:protein TonB
MMTQAQLATASLNDIVFDGRNKEYGAYELRALYERHVKQALAWASVVLLLLLLYPVVSRLLADTFPAPVEKHTGIVDLTGVVIDQPRVVVPPVVPPVAPPPATQARPNTIKHTEYVVANKESDVTEDVPNVEDLVDKQVGKVTFTGGTDNALPLDLPVGDGKGDARVADVVAKPEIFFSVEQMPEMLTGGGLAGIVAAIQKAVRYPGIDLRNGVEGRVHASFIVNPQGEITEIKIVRGLSPTLDAETIRAIGTLPRLKPGKQNGQAVNVAFNVPITYKIQ